jgi:hypothetical protein
MTKVVCIKQDDSFSLPSRVVYLGIIYLVKINRLYNNLYEVSKDDVYLGLFSKSNFITLAELREQQIKSVLDD